MDLLTVLLFAVALCFDSFAVSISCGLACFVWQRGRGIRFAMILALMQGFMVFIGWALAFNFHSIISEWDHWVSFVLLLFLGGKMIYGAVRGDDQPVEGDPFRLWPSIVLGFATSIDAIIAGVSMAFLVILVLPTFGQLVNIGIVSLIVALVTFSASIIGLLLGRRSRGSIGPRAELIGGCVLIIIGIKVLMEHLL